MTRTTLSRIKTCCREIRSSSDIEDMVKEIHCSPKPVVSPSETKEEKLVHILAERELHIASVEFVYDEFPAGRLYFFSVSFTTVQLQYCAVSHNNRTMQCRILFLPFPYKTDRSAESGQILPDKALWIPLNNTRNRPYNGSYYWNLLI